MKPDLRVAMMQHRNGELDQAEAAYRDILARSPGNADALHYLGVLLHQKGDSKAGERLIRKAIKRSVGYIDAHKNLGNVLAESGKLDKAEASYRKALEIDAEDAGTWNNLCVLLRNQKRWEEAVEAGVRAVNAAPENALGWLNFGKSLKHARMIEPAIKAYYRALKLDREMVEAHQELCHTLYLLEKSGGVPDATLQERVLAYRQWLDDDPENPLAEFMLAACTGDCAHPRMPDAVVRKLFDSFAPQFDQNLASLDYRVPDHIAAELRRVYCGETRDLTVLDAGCGTGLCAAHLRPLAANLTGVDLSRGMLEQARRRGLYDSLVADELTAYLAGQHSVFDLIVCADTFCYFGSLAEVFVAAASALAEGGTIIFTVERLGDASGGDFAILTSGRYCHREDYVKSTLQSSGLEMTHLNQVDLRMEGAEAVRGLVVTASLRS